MMMLGFLPDIEHKNNSHQAGSIDNIVLIVEDKFLSQDKNEPKQRLLNGGCISTRFNFGKSRDKFGVKGHSEGKSFDKCINLAFNCRIMNSSNFNNLLQMIEKIFITM